MCHPIGTLNWLASEWHSIHIYIYTYMYISTLLKLVGYRMTWMTVQVSLARHEWAPCLAIAVGDCLGWRRQATRWVPKRFDPGVWQIVCSLAKVGRQARCADLHESLSKHDFSQRHLLSKSKTGMNFPYPSSPMNTSRYQSTLSNHNLYSEFSRLSLSLGKVGCKTVWGSKVYVVV